MAESLLDYAPPEFARVLAGEPVPPAGGGEPVRAEIARTFTMANFIVAAVDSYSADWTDYTNASSAHYPATPSVSLEAADAHLPSYIRADLEADRMIPDERLAEAVRAALPSVGNVCARPSASVPEMGVWTCPECAHTIDPMELTIGEAVLIASYLGVGPDCGVRETDRDGLIELDRDNPWLFMRCIDCLAWSHLAEHLATQCVTFWFPSPVSAYQSGPGLWWDQERLLTRATWLPLRTEVDALERTAQYNFRMWKVKKMIDVADRGLHAARFQLTRWRRDAIAARETLVRTMFGAGRSIVDTGLALVHLVEQQETEPARQRLQEDRDTSRSLRRTWLRQKERWARMYLGN
ncbi:unnamed protein product [Peniophora sp. CBMAI 1063]|nr:unnamed protein product [Peniophora sp. CBMAI 1063]